MVCQFEEDHKRRPCNVHTYIHTESLRRWENDCKMGVSKIKWELCFGFGRLMV
jgi:hypothetical protein